MKKTTLLLSLLVIAISLSAQRIGSLTIDGATSLVPFAAFNPTNNSDTKLGDGQIIYPNTTDLSNATVSINVGSDSSVESPNPLPTNWSSTVSNIKVTKTDLSSWAKYNITIKKIKAATLPLEILTGAGNFNSDDWTPETVGWAGACIDKNQNIVRFGSAGRSFMVAFDSAPDSLIYTIKYLTTAWSEKDIFDVDGSSDGINWTSIIQYNRTTEMPISSPTVITKLDISNEFRFIRWVYTTRLDKSNVSLENILVTKDIIDNTLSPKEQGVKLYNAGSESLRLDNSEEVKSLRIYSISGALVLEEMNPSSTITFREFDKGVYLGEITLKSGNTLKTKFLR